MSTLLFARYYVANKLNRKFDVSYDALTQNITVLDTLDKLEMVSEQLKSDSSKLLGAIRRMKLTKK